MYLYFPPCSTLMTAFEWRPSPLRGEVVGAASPAPVTVDAQDGFSDLGTVLANFLDRVCEQVDGVVVVGCLGVGSLTVVLLGVIRQVLLVLRGNARHVIDHRVNSCGSILGQRKGIRLGGSRVSHKLVGGAEGPVLFLDDASLQRSEGTGVGGLGIFDDKVGLLAVDATSVVDLLDGQLRGLHPQLGLGRV